MGRLVPPQQPTWLRSHVAAKVKQRLKTQRKPRKAPSLRTASYVQRLAVEFALKFRRVQTQWKTHTRTRVHTAKHTSAFDDGSLRRARCWAASTVILKLKLNKHAWVDSVPLRRALISCSCFELELNSHSSGEYVNTKLFLLKLHLHISLFLCYYLFLSPPFSRASL